MTSQQPPEPFLMDCARAQDMIFDHLESAANSAEPVSAEDQAALDKHLADCDECLVYRHTLQNLNVSLSELDEVPVPTGLEDRIMATIAENEARKSKASPLALFAPRAKRYAPVAAAVLVIAVAIPLIMQQFTGHQPGTHTGSSTDPQVAQGTHGPSVVPTPAPVSTQPTPSAPPAFTELASVPNPAPPSATVQPNQKASSTPQPATGHSTAKAMRTRPAVRTAVAAGSQSTINGQQLAYNPDGSDNFPGASANGSQNQGMPNQSDQANGGSPRVDASSLASAIPQSASQHFSSTYSSEDESDVYYDPVSNLVGF